MTSPQLYGLITCFIIVVFFGAAMVLSKQEKQRQEAYILFNVYLAALLVIISGL
jgi:hypothetical protein